MNSNEKCVNRDTARKLNEEGFPQDTERWWQRFDTNPELFQRSEASEDGWCLQDYISDDALDTTAAPDAQEIGALLPTIVKEKDGRKLYLSFSRVAGRGIRKGTLIWHVFFVWHDWDNKKTYVHTHGNFLDENEAEARAAMWLWLKEQKLL